MEEQKELGSQLEFEKEDNRPSSQEAGYETPIDENDCVSQVEKHDSEDEDEGDQDLDDNVEKSARINLEKSENNGLVEHSVATCDPATKEFQQLYSEEEMLAVTTTNTTLANENRRLKLKLSKAKSQLDTLTQKHNSVHESLKAMEGKLAQQIERNSSLRYELDEIRRNQDKLDKGEVTDILARVKVGGTGYTLIQESSGKTVWHADQQIVKIQKQLYSEWKKVL